MESEDRDEIAGDGSASVAPEPAADAAVDHPADAEAAPDPVAMRETRATLAITLRAVLVSGLVLTAGSALAFDLQVGAAVLAGSVLATVNLVLFARLVRAFVAQGGASAPWAVLGSLKLVGLFACVYILVKRGGISPIGLGLGYASLPLGITFATLFRPPRGSNAAPRDARSAGPPAT